MRCIVFWSHGSAATISALQFNFGYWPEPHCSPAFPNLGGIPPPGNMVYKRRHQAQPLAETPPATLHPPGNIYCMISSTLFPSPLEQYPVQPSLCWHSESPGLSHQGVTQRGAGSPSIRTSRHTENLCVVRNWFYRGSRRSGGGNRVWSDESLSYDPSPQWGCLWSSWVSSSLLPMTSQTIRQ